MSGYYLLKPGVYGQMGRGTKLDPSVHPPFVSDLHFVFDAPPRDDLHASFPCFMVSHRLGRQITEAGLSGAELGEVRIDIDNQYLEDHPDTPNPDVFWLKVRGRSCIDDFGLDERGRLVVSEAAMQILRQFPLNDCRIYNGEHPPTPEETAKDARDRAKQVAEQLRRN